MTASECSPSAAANHRRLPRARPRNSSALSQPSVSHQVAALEQSRACSTARADCSSPRPARPARTRRRDRRALRPRRPPAAFAEYSADDERALLRIGAFPTALVGRCPWSAPPIRAPGSRWRRAPADELPERVRSGSCISPSTSRTTATTMFEDRERVITASNSSSPLPLIEELAGQQRLRRTCRRRLDRRLHGWAIVRACRAAGFERVWSRSRAISSRIRPITRVAVTLAPRRRRRSRTRPWPAAADRGQGPGARRLRPPARPAAGTRSADAHGPPPTPRRSADELHLQRSVCERGLWVAANRRMGGPVREPFA